MFLVHSENYEKWHAVSEIASCLFSQDLIKFTELPFFTQDHTLHYHSLAIYQWIIRQCLNCVGQFFSICYIFALLSLLISELPSEMHSLVGYHDPLFIHGEMEIWNGYITCKDQNKAAKQNKRGTCPFFSPCSNTFLTSSLFWWTLGPEGIRDLKKQRNSLLKEKAHTL